MNKTKIQIITPPVASSNREMDLVNLTEYLIKNEFAEYYGGGLGGEYGYGCHFENGVFAIRPYYWGDCDCGADDYNEQLSGNCDVTELKDHSEDCSLSQPNFHYKPTDFCVDWYKWIGRETEYSDEISDEEWRKMFEHCLDSVRKNK